MKNLKLCMLAAAASLLATGAMAQMAMDPMVKMTMGKKPDTAAQGAHKASATVTKVDEKAGVVTLAHGPVPTLNWPAMTMGFKVKDKSLLPKLAQGKKVDVEFTKEGNDYVVTSVK